MAYFGVTLGSGKRIIVEATSQEAAWVRARKDHPGEKIVDAVYLTLMGGEVWTPTM